MNFQKSTRYALYASMELARANGGEQVTVAQVAGRYAFLAEDGRALRVLDLADPAAGPAGLLAAVAGAAAVTGLALAQRGHADFPGDAADGFFEIQFHGVAQVGPPLALGAAPAAAAENVAENIAEDVPDIAVKPARPTRTRPLVDAGMAVAVVGGAFLRVLENLVRLLGLLETLLGRFVIRIAVRMVFHGKPTIGFFQLVVARRALHAQGFVIIGFRHASRSLSILRLICGC